MDVEFRVEGLDGIHRAIGQISAEAGDKAMTRALRKALAPLVSQARAATPVGTGSRFRKGGKPIGHLRDSIKVRSSKTGVPGEVAVYVGPSRAHFYGAFVELGTRRSSAKPFLRPAFDAHAKSIPQTFGEAMWAEIEAALQKAGNRP